MKTKKIYTDINKVPFTNKIEEKYYNGYEVTKNTYQFRLTNHLINLINDTNNSGLIKQFLPDKEELEYFPNEFIDVSDEDNNSPVPGIIHRYPNKVLLILTINCPSYCRFCFRKERINDSKQRRFLSEKELENAFKYIKENKIEEVIFTGGDPFFCSKKLLRQVQTFLIADENIKIVRYHTRYFTFDPNSIDDEIINIVKKKKGTFMVMHINQAEELSKETISAIDRCVDNGIPVFSQTALLKGINDSEEVLKKLFTSLVHNRVKPYYLFHTDPAQGLSHFRVKLSDGIKLYKKLYDRITGLGMPIYLINIPGGFGHVIIDLNNVNRIDDISYEFEAWDGTKVIFKDI